MTKLKIKKIAEDDLITEVLEANSEFKTNRKEHFNLFKAKTTENFWSKFTQLFQSHKLSFVSTGLAGLFVVVIVIIVFTQNPSSNLTRIENDNPGNSKIDSLKGSAGETSILKDTESTYDVPAKSVVNSANSISDTAKTTVRQRPAPIPGQLTAGEWNDLENWDLWRSLMINLAPVSEERNNNVQQPQNCLSMVESYGFNPLKPSFSWSEYISQEQEKKTNQSQSKLDLVFMIDTTGSMGDELNYIKSELKDVVQRVKSNNPNIKIRIATVYYRDDGDQYLTRHFDFTEDIDQTITEISRQSADGGGDRPEAVPAGLDVVVNNLQWDNSSTSKLVFWVADAPFRNDNHEVAKFQDSLTTARTKNIKIVPVASSEIDKSTEMLMRATAIYTGGTYIFLTDDSGIGNSHIKPTVGKYEVKYLNNLLVEVINRSL